MQIIYESSTLREMTQWVFRRDGASWSGAMNEIGAPTADSESVNEDGSGGWMPISSGINRAMWT